MLKGVLTTTRRRLIVAMAAVAMLAPAGPAKGATFWTIRAEKSNPPHLIGLSLEGVRNGQPTVWPVLTMPMAGALDQHWRLRNLGVEGEHRFIIINRQSGQCLSPDPPSGSSPAEVIMARCTVIKNRFTFHRPGSAQRVSPGVSGSGTYQLRNFLTQRTGERYGRCLAVVPYPNSEVGGRLATQPCSRAPNQRFVLSRFSAP